ncbi:MAG: hypothetical protein ACLFRN_07125 [Halothece sp.]
MVQQIEQETENHPWWNRPILGENSAWQSLKEVFSKAEIPNHHVIEHNRMMREVEKLAGFIATLDNEKFDHPEFALLVKTKNNLERETIGYQGLKDSAELFQASLQAKESFIGIEQIEFQYRGFVQQKFYDQVFQLLSKQLLQAVFLKLLDRLAQQALSQVKSEEGKVAIRTYVEEINALASKHKLGLQLLLDFKRNQFEDFSLLTKISSLVSSFKTQEVHYSEPFLVEVKFNYDLFSSLGNIIKMPEHQKRPEGYAKLLQYIVLIDKHKRSYQQLEQLLEQLKKWYQLYQKIVALRQHYHSKDYKQPSEFKKPIPGFWFYQKYQRWLLQSIMKKKSSADL